MDRSQIVRRRARTALGAACVIMLGIALAFAQAPYPSRLVNFIVPWGAGGGSDQAGREIARHLSDLLKQPVPVINMPGATGTIGIAKLVGSPADGYTLGLMAADTYALLASSPQRARKAARALIRPSTDRRQTSRAETSRTRSAAC